jgi:RIO kinase 1
MIELGPILVKGGWCQIFAVQGHPNLCAKVLVPKRRFKGIKPEPDAIVNAKYGIGDFLEYEWNNYMKIMTASPDDLRSYFVTMHGIEPTTDGRKALVMETVRNDLGEIAPNLVKNTRSLEPEFWNALERVRTEVFLARSVDHFGIVRRNILVRNPQHPVIIDFQTGRERFRGQFWLRLPWFVRQKTNRCFRKLYKEMGLKPVF